jgi:hypothetical protein
VIRRIVVATVAGLLVGGCALLPAFDSQGPADLPKPCAAVYSVARCQAMTDVAAAEAGKNRDDVTAVAIVPDPPPVGVTLGAAWPIRVRIALTDGSVHETRICGGVSIDPACSAEPHLMPRSAIGAYTDIPCGAEPADGPEDCATPFPRPGADVVAQATPVRIDDSTISIDHIGQYEVRLGRGSLPNGLLTEASFEFVDTWPDDVALRDGKAFLGVRSLEADGKPFDNYYSHGARPGVERIETFLTFDVLWFAPGATLKIRNVVVR